MKILFDIFLETKKIIGILFTLFFVIGCKDQKLTPQNIVNQYYSARNIGNYKLLKNTIADSITVTAGDFVMPYNRTSFYEQFKWDSIFKPSYDIIELKEQNNQIIAVVSINSMKHEFLKNSFMTCEYKISFTNDKISKIEELACPEADWKIWETNVSILVNWIHENHPELDGFIQDLTMQGAKDYMKAIELYRHHVMK